jgi:hypothetical protein
LQKLASGYDPIFFADDLYEYEEDGLITEAELKVMRAEDEKLEEEFQVPT